MMDRKKIFRYIFLTGLIILIITLIPLFFNGDFDIQPMSFFALFVGMGLMLFGGWSYGITKGARKER